MGKFVSQDNQDSLPAWDSLAPYVLRHSPRNGKLKIALYNDVIGDFSVKLHLERNREGGKLERLHLWVEWRAGVGLNAGEKPARIGKIMGQ